MRKKKKHHGKAIIANGQAGSRMEGVTVEGSVETRWLTSGSRLVGPPRLLPASDCKGSVIGGVGDQARPLRSGNMGRLRAVFPAVSSCS